MMADLTPDQADALVKAAVGVIQEWEAYSGEGMPGWTAAEVNALGDAIAQLTTCAYCGQRLRLGTGSEAGEWRGADGRYFCTSPDALHHPTSEGSG